MHLFCINIERAPERNLHMEIFEQGIFVCLLAAVFVCSFLLLVFWLFVCCLFCLVFHVFANILCQKGRTRERHDFIYDHLLSTSSPDEP